MVHYLRGGQSTEIIFFGLRDALLLKNNLLKKIFTSIGISKNIIQKANKKAKELNIQISWMNNISGERFPINKCVYSLEPFISVSGEVFPYCLFLSYKSVQKEMICGNIFEHNFKKIWLSKKYKNFRKLLNEGKVPVSCRNCGNFKADKD